MSVMEEFKFPDQQSKSIETPKEEEFDVLVEGDEKEQEEDVVVVDDTPPEDRGRKPLGKTADEVAPDTEVEEYSASVKKRIAELKHTYHDERRAKEEAERQKDEALRLAQAVYAENKRLREQSAGWQKAGNEALKTAATKELETASRELKAAYESGDSDAVVKATEAVADAKLKIAQAVSFKPQAEENPPLQERENAVQTTQPSQAPRPDERSLRWQQDNKWFGKDEEMTAYALGLHQKLVNTGVDPRTEPDKYYERLNARIREKFPEAFEDASAEEDSPPKKPAKATPAATVVAPASRNSAPKKVVLSRSQEAIARSLGVPLKEYARQMRLLNESETK